jgi:hypothetical protein
MTTGVLPKLTHTDLEHYAEHGWWRSPEPVFTAGVDCAVDALVQPPAGAACGAVRWAVSGAATVTHPAPGSSRLDFAGGSLVRLGHLDPGTPTGWAALSRADLLVEVDGLAVVEVRGG